MDHGSGFPTPKSKDLMGTDKVGSLMVRGLLNIAIVY